MEVDYTGHLVVQFSEREQEGNDEIIYFHPEEYQLDLKHFCMNVSVSAFLTGRYILISQMENPVVIRKCWVN